MKETYIPSVDERVYFEDIEGLKTYVFKKEGFSRKMISLSVNYGSVNTAFSVDGGDIKKYPEGIAHFLEHKLFESEKDSIFEEFSRLGASVNAFTDYNTTCYYFTCVDKHIESTDNLIKMVFNPHITDENVEKEKGIIIEELKLYMDSPQNRLINELYDSMYFENPVRFDIGGTPESVSKITRDDLMDCYNAYYQKENMVLVCVGDVDPEEFASSVRRSLPKRKHIKVIDAIFKEKKEIKTSEKTIEMKLSSPTFAMGFKDNGLSFDKLENYRRSITASLFTRLAFGRTSDFYEINYRNGKINDSLFCEYISFMERGELFIGMETEQPNEFKKLTLDYFEKDLKTKRFYEERTKDLNLIKKAVAGNFISRFDSVDSINHMVFRNYLRGTDPFIYNEMIKNVSAEDLYQFALSINTGNNLSCVFLK